MTRVNTVFMTFHKSKLLFEAGELMLWSQIIYGHRRELLFDATSYDVAAIVYVFVTSFLCMLLL